MPGTVIYLHGLLSSPLSTKALFFQKRLAARGLQVVVPDLNQDDFGTLTVSRAVDQTVSLIDEAAGGPEAALVMMGSSFGGLTSALAASVRPEAVRAAVLMAPAFDMAGLWERQLGPDGMAAWKREGFLSLEHPAYPLPQGLRYGFYLDAVERGTDPVKLAMPSLLFHGRKDDVVDPALAEAFGALNPEAEVFMLDDVHDLLESQEFMAEKVDGFLDRVLGRTWGSKPEEQRTGPNPS